MAKLASVPERRARFREEKQLAVLTTSIESRGWLTYRRPDYLEKVTSDERLIVDGRWLTLIQGNDAPRVIDLRSTPELDILVQGLRAPLSGDLPGLQRAFTVTASGTLAAWRLELVPRSPEAAKFVRQMSLTGEGDAIRAVHVVQANGDEQWMQIEPAS